MEDDLFHTHAKKLFSDIHTGKKRAFTSVSTLEELAHVVLLRRIQSEYNEHPKEVLRKNPEVVGMYAPLIEDMFTVIFSFANLELVDTTQGDISYIPAFMKQNFLLSQDALHLATMKRFSCTTLVSTDSDFDEIEGIKRIPLDKW